MMNQLIRSQNRMNESSMINEGLISMMSNRINACSDGIIAIIITIMVFNIPMPTSFDEQGIISMLFNIGVFLVSFMIVGMQWIKHCSIFALC